MAKSKKCHDCDHEYTHSFRRMWAFDRPWREISSGYGMCSFHCPACNAEEIGPAGKTVRLPMTKLPSVFITGDENGND